MKSFSRIVMGLFALVVFAGCASTNVTQQTPMSSPRLARPNQIWVYSFVAAPADMPADSSISGQMSAPSTPPTAEQIETGRKGCGQAFRHRFRRGNHRDGYGGRRLRGDAARLAQTRLGDADLLRRKNAGDGSTGRRGDRYRQSDRPDCRRRDENLWGGKRQEQTRGESQGDRRRNCGAAQNPIPGSGLDPVNERDGTKNSAAHPLYHSDSPSKVRVTPKTTEGCPTQ